MRSDEQEFSSRFDINENIYVAKGVVVLHGVTRGIMINDVLFSFGKGKILLLLEKHKTTKNIT